MILDLSFVVHISSSFSRNNKQVFCTIFESYILRDHIWYVSTYFLCRWSVLYSIVSSLRNPPLRSEYPLDWIPLTAVIRATIKRWLPRRDLNRNVESRTTLVVFKIFIECRLRQRWDILSSNPRTLMWEAGPRSGTGELLHWTHHFL
jgi:hypothetical protein